MTTYVATKRAESLTETLFSLEEPWRSRFLYLIANRATGGQVCREQPPSKEEVTNWLGNGSLQQAVTLLLKAWQ
jgi:hypothetical protein